MATAVSPAQTRFIRTKHVIWTIFALMSLFVVFTREWTLLDSHSFLRQRYARIPWLMLAHGVPGALALLTLLIGAAVLSVLARVLVLRLLTSMDFDRHAEQWGLGFLTRWPSGRSQAMRLKSV